MARKFQLLPNGGKHSEGNRVFKPGEIVHSDKDLVALFPNKFICLGEDAPAPIVEQEESTEKPEAPESSVETENGLGVDVTTEFQTAVDGDLLVYKNGKRYFVAEADAPQTSLNEEGLTKSKVEEFLTKYLGKS